MKILVTGAAGFIGSKLMGVLASRGDEVVGIDSINNYYDVRLKYGRLSEMGIILNDEFVWNQPIQSLSMKLVDLYGCLLMTGMPWKNFLKGNILKRL